MKKYSRRKRLVLLCLYFLLFSLHFLGEETSAAYYRDSLSPGRLRIKVLTLGGQIRLGHFLYSEDKKSGLYKLKHFQRLGKTSSADQLQMQLWGKHEGRRLQFFWKLSSSTQNSYLKRYNGLEEAYLTWHPNEKLSWYAGKKIFSWGKTWNPLAFLDYPQDPFDPDPPRQGLIIIGAEYKQNFFSPSDPLQALTFTPLIFPVQEKVNEDFGQAKHWNLAAQLSILFWNTKLNFVALQGKSRPERYGFGFSRGTAPLEIYGDFWVSPRYEKVFLDQTGQLWKTQYAAFGSLWGLQYEKNDWRCTAEYYRRKAGFTPQEMSDYYHYLHAADSDSEGSQADIKRMTILTEKYYQNPELMQEYAYAKIFKQNPFQIKQLTWSIAGIWNLQDRSFALCPRLRYDSTSNLRLELKSIIWQGKAYSEFGEKINDWAVEFYLTYSFELSLYRLKVPRESLGTLR